MRRRGNISKRCMVCIMSAMMMMSSVTGTMITPMGAYATPYATTTEVPEDTDGHRNLASEDTLDVNDGTIHENRGTIRENNGTVEDNNSGTVVSNSGTVNWGNVTTNESSGTVVAATVTDNYGTATEDSTVTNNYALAVNSTVTNNWASGTVSGTSLVTNNHGGRIDGDGVTVSNTLESDPGPNPPVQEVKPINNPTDTIPEVQPDTPKQEENNDPPQTLAPTNIVGVTEIENAITTQLNNMPADSTNGEIMLEFGTNTNIDADMMYALLTYTPEGSAGVNEPIFCSFKIDGVTYYLRIDRGTQISAEQIKSLFANNKSEGPMQIAQWFGNYGVSLVPSYDAILKLLEPELPFMNGDTLEKIGLSEFNTKEDVNTRFNKIVTLCKDDMKKRIEDHKDDDIANLSDEQLETYYSQIFGDLKDGGKYKEEFDAEFQLAIEAEREYIELLNKNDIKANYLDDLLRKAEKSGPSCLTSDMKSLKKAGDAINTFRGEDRLDEKAKDFYSSLYLSEKSIPSRKEEINDELEDARHELYRIQRARVVAAEKAAADKALADKKAAEEQRLREEQRIRDEEAARKNGEKLEGELEPDLEKYINRDVHENEPHNNSIAPTNATIAPVNAKMASVEQEQNAEAIAQSVKDKLDNSQLSSDGASIVIANGDSYSTLMFAYMDTANVKSEYLNKDAKADVYLTLVDKELTKGASLDQAINDAKKSLKKMNNDLTEDIPNNLTDEQKKAYVETYVMTYKQYMANNVSYDNARKQALLQAANAANAVYEQNQTAAITNANAAIAPVFGTVKGDHSGALGD